MKRARGNPGLKGRLLDNSVEAYVLALETINRLSIKYRVEAFLYLICNAWELMLKAKIIHDSGSSKSIYHKRKKGGPLRSLALRDCLERVFPNEKDPTRRNIELMVDLRDEATHLVISRVPRDVLSLFQAGVLNYHKRLGEWWGISLSERVPVGMMTLVYDLGPEDLDLSSAALRKELGSDTAKYLAQFQAEVHEEYDRLGKPPEFSVGIEYKLVLTKKPGDADITLTSGPNGSSMRVVEVPKEPGKTHPYRQKELLEVVGAELGEDTRFTSHDVQCISKVHGVAKRPEFFYQSPVPNSPKQYSQQFADWIIGRYRNNGQFFVETRRKAKGGAGAPL